MEITAAYINALLVVENIEGFIALVKAKLFKPSST